MCITNKRLAATIFFSRELFVASLDWEKGAAGYQVQITCIDSATSLASIQSVFHYVLCLRKTNRLVHTPSGWRRC